MNCCDAYGNCRQGRDCPVRRRDPADPAGPATVAKAKPLRRCEDMGVCMHPGNECRTNCRLHEPLEAPGNPQDALSQRLQGQADEEAVALELLLYWLLALVVAGLLAALGGVLVGFAWVRWGDAISNSLANTLWQMAALLS